MSKTRNLTCIVCPRGCQMVVTLADDGKVMGVEGNFCKRGVTYANDECTNPKRTVTSTVKCTDGGIVSVKTSAPVPKEKVFEVMREINLVRCRPDVKIGDEIISDVCSLGVSVVATSNKNV